MYVGEIRLDYIKCFLDGLSICKIESNSEDIWAEDYELQYWIMAKHSACIRNMATLNGWSLFFHCFGTRTTAMVHFSQYLHDNIPKPPFIKTILLHEMTAAYNVYSLENKLKQDSKSLFAVKSLIHEIIKGLIEEEDNDYDNIRIYIYRDRYFCQIRFVYHTPNGWRDDNQILAKVSNYNKFLRLHAAVEFIENEDIPSLSENNETFYFYLNYDNTPNEHGLSIPNYDVPDENSLYNKYIRWKEHFTHTF